MVEGGGHRKPKRPSRLWAAALLSLLLVAVVVLPLARPGARALAAGSGPKKIVDALGSLPRTPVDRKHLMGLKPTPPSCYVPLDVEAGGVPLGTPLGAAVDLSSQLPPVGNQGQQGSCVGWATGYYYKTWSEKQEHKSWSLTDPQHQFSPSFVYNQINGGRDNGAYFDDAFHLLQTKGCVDMAEFPYSQHDYRTRPDAGQLEAAKPYRIPSGWGAFWTRQYLGPYSPPNDIEGVKSWLAAGKVLVMGIPVYMDFPNYGSSPARTYYDYNESANLAGGHAVCIVGYNDNINPGGSNADHRGGFKMVNSWGPSWNGPNAGFVYLSYDFVKRFVWEAWSMGDLDPDSPSLSSLSRSSGQAGTSVVISGNNFGTRRRSACVKFNGLTAATANWVNNSITAIVPSGATSGPVVVYDWEGTASNPIAFTVSGGGGAPAVTAVSPGTGESGTQISASVSGSDFADGCQVRLTRPGRTAIQATGETLVGAGRVDCSFNLSGAEKGAWDVVVANPGGLSGVLTGGFSVTAYIGNDTYEPNNPLTNAYGPISAGNAYRSYIYTDEDDDYYRVQVPERCRRFTATLRSIPAGCDYDFKLYNSHGADLGGSYNCDNRDEEVTVSTPAAGTYYLRVYPFRGCSDTHPYLLGFSADVEQVPAPAIDRVSPRSGKVGKVVSIYGRNFGEDRGDSYVLFGSKPVTEYLEWEDNFITVRVPRGVYGKTYVSVVTALGNSNGVLFKVVPRIKSVKPASGMPGTVVTISGRAFGPNRGSSYVRFGSKKVRKYESWRNGVLKVKVPPDVRGDVHVRVFTAGGTSNPVSFTVTVNSVGSYGTGYKR